MTEAPRDRPRGSRLAVVTGSIAVALSVTVTVVWVAQLVTLQGGERFFLLNTLTAFVVGALIWIPLAVVSLTASRRARAGRVATLGVITLAATAVCVVLALITLFQ